MEASGGYERLAFLLLWQAGQPCGLVNARNVRRFAEAMGALEKTDRIDAAMIARFGQARRAAPTPPPSPAQQHLRALVTRLSQVTDDLVANRQRKGAAADPEAVESLEEVIALLLAQLVLLARGATEIVRPHSQQLFPRVAEQIAGGGVLQSGGSPREGRR
jgi:transposase